MCVSRLLVLLLVLSSGVSMTVSAAGKPQLLVSIKPLALIAQELAGDRMDVQTLIPDAGSHHDYPLKPSDHAAIQRADLIVWVGPNLESFLSKPLASRKADAQLQINLMTALHWPGSGDHDADPHFWLDITNLKLVVQALAIQLGKQDPTGKDIYAARAEQLNARLSQLDTRLQQTLGAYSSSPFVVYHDGLAHWAYKYHLTGYGFIALTPEQKPGAKHLMQLRRKYSQSGACLFLEPGVESGAAEALAKDLGMKLGILDIMGVSGVSRIDQLLEKLGVAFVQCLKGSQI